MSTSNCTLNKCAQAAGSSSLKKMFDRSGREIPYFVCILGGAIAASLAAYFMWNCYGDDEEDLGSGFGSSHGKKKRDQRLERERVDQEEEFANVQSSHSSTTKKNENKSKRDDDEDDDEVDFDFSPLRSFEREFTKLNGLVQELQRKLESVDSADKLAKISHEFHAVDEQITHMMIKMDGVSVSSDQDRNRRKKLLQDCGALSALIQPLYTKKK